MSARSLLTSLVLPLAGAAIVALLAISVITGVSRAADQLIIDFVRADALNDILAPLRVITELGSTPAVTVVAVVVLSVGVAIGTWREGLAGAVAIGLASIANAGLKLAIARDRPDLLEPIIVERGFSFPSGHSALGMVAYGVLAVLISRSRLPIPARRATIGALTLLVFLIGVSRVWLGVHYPTDVLGGWTAGAVVVALYATLTRGVSEPTAGAVDADQAEPRSGPPAAG